MFCKWCGAQTGPGNQTCNRCGRKIPALSDCGGFYDLVPKAHRQTETREESKNESAKSARRCKRGRMPVVILYVVAAALVLSVLLQAVVLVHVSRLNGMVQGIAERIEDNYDIEDVKEEPGAGENTGSTTATDSTAPVVPTEDGAANPPEAQGDTENAGVGENTDPEEDGETNLPEATEETPPTDDRFEA